AHAEKLALTQQIRHRLAGAPALEQLAKPSQLERRERLLRGHDQADAIEAEHAPEQQLDIEPARVGTALFEGVGGPSQDATHRPNLAGSGARGLAGAVLAQATPALRFTLSTTCSTSV